MMVQHNATLDHLHMSMKPWTPGTEVMSCRNHEILERGLGEINLREKY